MDYEALKRAVISGKAAQVKELTQQALVEEGRDPREVVDQGLIPAMDIVRHKFASQEFYLPEMLIAARAMRAGIDLLKPQVAAEARRPRGRVVIETVHGDLHDIGRNRITLMLQRGGFEVI